MPAGGGRNCVGRGKEKKRLINTLYSGKSAEMDNGRVKPAVGGGKKKGIEFLGLPQVACVHEGN